MSTVPLEPDEANETEESRELARGQVAHAAMEARDAATKVRDALDAYTDYRNALRAAEKAVKQIPRHSVEEPYLMNEGEYATFERLGLPSAVVAALHSPSDTHDELPALLRLAALGLEQYAASAEQDLTVAEHVWATDDETVAAYGFEGVPLGQWADQQIAALTPPCPRCGGLGGEHGLVHVRHDAGGGGWNEPCPNTPREGKW